MPTNRAAYLLSPKAHPFSIRPAPYTRPSPSEVVIKTAAVAINPIDRMVQDQLFDVGLSYPAILGEDVAGKIVEVGSAVESTRLFAPGDRVLAHAMMLASKRPAEGAFQEYVLVPAIVVARIPDSVSFEQAAVIPLGLSTAAVGLFQKPFLELRRPVLEASSSRQTGTSEVVLVWGGASSVGTNAVQLATAAGYEVFATASSKNFEYVQKLGAARVFDYKAPDIEDDIVNTLREQGKTLVGIYDAINQHGAIQHCAHIAAKAPAGNTGKKPIASVLQVPADLPLADGVSANWVFAVKIKNDDTAAFIYNRFLPKALADGRFVPAPEPYVVGKGLEEVQKGMDERSKGVSAKKVVVTL